MDILASHNQLKIDTVIVSTGNTAVVDTLNTLCIQSLDKLNSLTNSIPEIQNNKGIWGWVSNDAIFATLTSVLVFSLGILAGYIRTKIKENRSKKQIRHFVKHHIDQVVQSYSSSLVDAYRHFAQYTTVDTGILLTPPKILSNDFERLLRIDSRELFIAFKDKKVISAIISNIDFLNHLLNEIQSYHEKVLERSNVLRNKISDELNEYLLSLADLVYFEETETENYQNTEPYNTINQSLVTFNNELNGSRELMNVLLQIIRPNQEFLVHNGYFRTHKHGREITLLGRTLNHLIDQLGQLTHEFKTQYMDFAHQTEDAINRIKFESNKIDW